MKHTKNQILNLGLLPLIVFLVSLSPLKAANVIFNFAQTTANGMDLFAAPGGTLITNSLTPNVFFSLGYVSSTYDFLTKTRQQLVNDITIIASSASSWSNVGTTGTATGGKVNISFDNGGAGFNTTSYVGSKLVAIVAQGVNPLGGAILDTTPLAIVRAGGGWDSVVATDGSPNPVNQTSLNVSDFSSILVGTYASLVGNVNSAGTTKYDTITLNAIPEPSSLSLIAGGGVVLWVMRRKQKGMNS